MEDNEDLYRVTVRETRVYENEYFIYAESEEQAREMAENGETAWENVARIQEVSSRFVKDVQEHGDY